MRLRFNHLLICMLFCMMSNIYTDAQVLDGFRFFCLFSDSYLDAEDYEIVANCLTDIGLRRIDFRNVDNLSVLDKKQTLIVGVNRQDDFTQVMFDDFMGSEIYSFTAKNKSSYRASKKKIAEQINNLHYSFNPYGSRYEYSPFVFWTESEFKNYFQSKSEDSLEGIYKNFNPKKDQCKIAIIEHEGKYYGFHLAGATYYSKVSVRADETFYRGNLRMGLERISNNKYDLVYAIIKSKGCPWRSENTIAEYNQGTLSFTLSHGTTDGVYPYDFIKIFPQNTSRESNNIKPSGELSLKSTGSGFVVSENVVATNYHVVESANTIKIALNTNGSLVDYNASILATDKNNDIALLIIKDDNYKPLKTIPYNILSSTIDVGSSVFTMGYPLSQVLGDEVKITDGIISSKTGFEGDVVTYQITAPIQPGNSGGPLFNKKGQLVGITNAGIQAAENVGYAIKSTYLLNLIDSAPIDISLPKGFDLSGKDLPYIIKLYTPYIAYIKVY